MSKIKLKWLLVLLLLLTALRFILQNSSSLKIENAYVSGQVVDVVASASGVLKDLNINRGDRIEKGEVLFTIDDTYTNLTIKRLIAELKFTIKNEVLSCAGINTSKSKHKEQLIDLELHQQQKKRSEILVKQRALSSAQLEIIESELKTDHINADLENRRLELELYKNRFSILDREMVQEVLAKLKIEYYKKEMLTIRAPYDGYIYDVIAYPGKLVSEGENLAILVSSEGMFVEANVLETKLEHIKTGTEVKVILDVSQGGGHINGVVHSIVPSTAAVFSPIPRNNTNSNWIKTSQRVPVLIALENNDIDSYVLPLGSSVQVIVPVLNDESTVHAAPDASKTAAISLQQLSTDKIINDNNIPEDSWSTEYEYVVNTIIQSEEIAFNHLNLQDCEFK